MEEAGYSIFARPHRIMSHVPRISQELQSQLVWKPEVSQCKTDVAQY